MRNLDTRPVYLNLLRIRQPVTAILSFGHRISGLLLFLALPVGLYLFERSLRGPAEFAAVLEFLASPGAMAALLLVLLMFLLHLFAGIRFLLIDVDVGVGLETARRSARAILWGAPAATVLLVLLYLW
jgi:succinate dehydrogenase / fumarate reductase cytochrome b subunit